jgi:ketosteroid isomerase-like protein
MDEARTDSEVRRWLDRLAIQDLINGYSDAVTRADWAQCEAVYAPHVLWESPGLGLRCEGRAAFMEMMRGTSTAGLLVQTPHASVISLTDSDQAHATTTIHEFIRGLARDGQQADIEQYGVYFDDVERIDGEWKFTHRLFVPLYRGDLGSGEILVSRIAPIRAG